MDLWRLHIFCKVIELKGFSRAAKAVHLSQPTISSHIQDLENHFGCQLIDRLGKEAMPTKAGELLYDYARRMIALRDETETALAEFHGKIKGRLVIGGSTIPSGYILPRLVGAFTNKHPEVTVSLIVGDTEKIIEETISGLLELSIVGAESSDKRIVQENLIDDEMQLIVPADHKWAPKKRITLEMLLKEPFILREHGSGTLRSINLSLNEKGYSSQELNVIAEMGSTAAVIQGIKGNVGISILSTIAVAEELRAGTLMALFIQGFNLKRSFYLTLHRHRSASPLGNAFVNFLKKELSAKTKP